jgi:hypothetical protein
VHHVKDWLPHLVDRVEMSVIVALNFAIPCRCPEPSQRSVKHVQRIAQAFAGRHKESRIEKLDWGVTWEGTRFWKRGEVAFP